jgi:DNA-binding CsgD family transcriptional regulator
MTTFDASEVKEVAALLSWAADPTIELELHERKRRLAERLARLVAADVWLWSSTIVNHNAPGDFVTACLIDGGWRDEAERATAFAALSTPEFGRDVLAPLYDMIQQGVPFTWICREFFGLEAWDSIALRWNKTGLNDFIMSCYPISADFSSNIAFHRRLTSPEFTEHERDLIHLVLGEVRWLHLHGSNSQAGEAATRLSPRERQVLVLLLGGDPQRIIAEKLSLSGHTVGDYMKQLNKRFGVTSRAELQARFFVGDIKNVLGEPTQS